MATPQIGRLPAGAELHVFPGDPLLLECTVTDGTDPVDLTGYGFGFTVGDIEADVTFPDAASGRFDVVMTAAQTTALGAASARHEWALVRTAPGDPLTWLIGTAQATRSFDGPSSSVDITVSSSSGDLTLEVLEGRAGQDGASGEGGGTAASTVESETAFGQAAAVGVGTAYARDDHTHGTPTDPVPAHAALDTGVHGVGVSTVESVAGALSKLATDPLARANHTGSQAQSTVTDLVTDLAALEAADKAIPLNPQAASYTLVLADAGKTVEMNNASANDLTVPPNSAVAFPVGTVVEVCQIGAGATTVVAGSGVTIQTPETLVLTGQWSTVSLRKRATDQWVLSGDVVVA